MTSCIAVIAIDADDVELIARFWTDVLGLVEVERDDGIVSLGPSDGAGPGVDVIHVPEGKAVKNRLHLDLRAKRTSTEQELERLLALGARRVDVGQPPDASWTVLADPEGNEFCLLATPAMERDGMAGCAPVSAG
jgi:catechol 2,3-dioxygenase-like lactoylglutathione lyase family enzyme